VTGGIAISAKDFCGQSGLVSLKATFAADGFAHYLRRNEMNRGNGFSVAGSKF
jgi:hypothetical protein